MRVHSTPPPGSHPRPNKRVLATIDTAQIDSTFGTTFQLLSRRGLPYLNRLLSHSFRYSGWTLEVFPLARGIFAEFDEAYTGLEPRRERSLLDRLLRLSTK